MIKTKQSQLANTLVYELSDHITKEDIHSIEPDMLDIEKNGQVNLVFILATTKQSLEVMIEEFRLSFRHWNKIHKIAYVGTGNALMPALVAVDNVFTKFNEKYFEFTDIDKMWEWIKE